MEQEGRFSNRMYLKSGVLSAQTPPDVFTITVGFAGRTGASITGLALTFLPVGRQARPTITLMPGSSDLLHRLPVGCGLELMRGVLWEEGLLVPWLQFPLGLKQ